MPKLLVFFILLLPFLSSADGLFGMPASEVTEMFGGEGDVHFRNSIAPDGFNTFYLDIHPLHTTVTQSTPIVVLIHGFAADSSYFLDYVKANEFLAKGYRVIIPDLMGRGKTLDLNFPLPKNGKKPIYRFNSETSWSANEQQAKWLANMTLQHEADYLMTMLKNLARDEGMTRMDLNIQGHSRGAGVAANLLFKIAKHNVNSNLVQKQVFMNVRSFVSLNGFVMYSTAALNSLLPLKLRDGKIAGLQATKTAQVYEDFVRLIDVQTQLQDLNEQTIDSPHSDEEVKEFNFLSEKNKLARRTLPKLMQLYSSMLDGPLEKFFIEILMEHSARLFQERYQQHRGYNPALYDREKKVLDSMMRSLRIKYRVQADEDGHYRASGVSYIIPDSVLGIYAKLAKRAYPGIPKQLHFLFGNQDKVVPPSQVAHIPAIMNQYGRSTKAVMVASPEGGHFGPDENFTINQVKELVSKANPRMDRDNHSGTSCESAL